MAREIFVVARDRPDLYRYLSQTFADAENVHVIWDRRNADRRDSSDRRHGPDRKEPEPRGERRSVVAGRAPERRRDERRRLPALEHELRSVGYAFITL